MPEPIVAHDVVCPWCWVAVRQAEWMRADFTTKSLRWVG
jgi:predicted DsbA family dithiol-disulfide isomerase